MLYNNPVYLRRFAYPIVNMQVINAIGQVRYVNPHCSTTFSGLLPHHIAKHVVEADVVSGDSALRPGVDRQVVQFDVKYIIYRIWID